jgi:hypothetical protein
MGFFLTETAGAWRRLSLRCLIIASLLVLALEIYSFGDHNWHLPYDARGILHMIGSFLGILLFLSSLTSLRQARTLAAIGIVVSIPAMLLVCLPTIIAR